MNTYIFTLNSDYGRHKITLHGHTCIESAIKAIKDIEKCPESAILNIKIVFKPFKP